MYWYYKYPLIAILILLFITGCFWIWRSIFLHKMMLDQKTDEPSQIETLSPPELPSLPTLPTPSATQEGKTENQLPQDTKSVPASTQQTNPSPVTEFFSSTLESARQELTNDNPKQARELALSLLAPEHSQEYSEPWMKAAAIVNEANKIFMTSKAPCPEKKTYVVKAGDSLTRIAYHNNTTVGALQKLNGLKTTSPVIHPGDSLQYIAGQWSIKVSKSHFLLTLYLDNQLFRIYRISTGRQDRTPHGLFIIKDKEMNPAWTPPGQNIPYGDPRNILGTRWMGLQPIGETDMTLKGYGIHGTTEPESIGTASSLGCVRMLNEEVEELYDFIPSSFKKLNITVTIIE